MAGTFSDSWKLTKTAFRMIAEDRALLVFPLIAGLSTLGVIALLVVGELFLVVPLGTSYGYTGGIDALGLVLFLAAYIGMAFLSVYCTGALIGAATMKLNGSQPTASDGWKIARAHLVPLLIWSLITATVGLALQAIANRVRGIGGLVISAVGGVAWSVATYFVIPVLLYESERPWPALKRSARLFASTFGRTIVSNLALGLLIGLGIVAAFIIGILGVVLLFTGATAVGIALLVLGLAIGVTVLLIGATAEGILVAALYRYATTGKIDHDLLPKGYPTGPLPSAPNPPG